MNTELTYKTSVANGPVCPTVQIIYNPAQRKRTETKQFVQSKVTAYTCPQSSCSFKLIYVTDSVSVQMSNEVRVSPLSSF